MTAVETQEKSVASQPLDYESLEKLTEIGSQPASSGLFSSKKMLLALLCVASTLIVCEALARIVVFIGKPVQYGQYEFDSKMAIAKQKLPANKPCLYLVGAS